MDEATARLVLGDDLGEERFAWCVERLVPEAPGLILEPVHLAPVLGDGVRRTWIRTLRDIVVPAEKQSAFAAQLAPCDVVDLDTGHMCMVSRPAELAALLDGIAATAG
jgi:pimeloyl-ACP methyl ester carboxylesterase